MLKICVITGARSEYGLQRWVMEEVRARPSLKLQVVATGSHFSERYGCTYREIEEDGFHIDSRLPMDLGSGRAEELAAAVGALTGQLAASLAGLKPDVVVFMGDRYEILSVIAAGALLGVPMAHTSGGEITEGAVDELVRHAATKASHLHFVANEEFARRVMQMGEEDWRVLVTGDPGLDGVLRLELMSRRELCKGLGLDADRPLGMVTFHPATLELDQLPAQLEALTTAMRRAHEELGVRFVITYPNADAGSEAIIAAMSTFVDAHPGSVLVKSLGRLRYLSALRELDFVLGNSSSGLFEAPSFNMPAVNVGTRQAGRMRGENVIDAPMEAEAILKAVTAALAYDRTRKIRNPYGEGDASRRLVDRIVEVFATRSRDEILRKKFVDRP